MAKEVLFNIRVDANFTKLVQLDQNMVKLVKRRNELIKLQKTENGLNAKQQKELTALNLTLSEQRKEKSRLTKEIQKGNKVRAKEISQFQRETNLANRLNKRLKEVILTKGATSREARRLAKRLQTVQTRLKSVSASAKQMTGSVGTARKGMGGFRASLATAAAGAAGMVGGVFALIGVFTDAIGKIRNFQQANANLAAVLGKSRGEIKALTADAKRLGSQTVFSASQVTELQTEFAKLGFTEQEILNVSEATLNLAAAVDTDLANAATIAGSTIRAFGLDTTDTTRVTDVMAKSFSSSSLDIEKFKTAMGAVAPVAKSAGFTLEQTTALIGTLTDAGIDASTAGTGLRGILLDISKTGLTLDEALAKINNSTNKNKTAFELFGKRGAAVSVVLADNVEKSKQLADTLENDSGKAAKMMADEQLKTLDGSIKILGSSWEGLILSMEDGSGVMSNISATVLRDMANGLSIVSGESKEAKKEFSLFGTILTLLKTNFKLVVGAIKIFLTPLRIMFDLIGKVINRFDFLRNAVNNTGDAFSNTTEIINNLPEIVDIVVSRIIDSFLELENTIKGVKDLVVGLFTFDTRQIEKGIFETAESFRNAFGFATDGIKADVKELFNTELKGTELDKALAVIAAKAKKLFGKEGGEDLGDDLAKGISKGLIESQSKIVSELQKAIQAATSEQEIIVLKAKLEFEKDELKRLQDLGKEITRIQQRSINDIRLEEKLGTDLKIEKAEEKHQENLKTTAGIFIEQNAQLLKDSAFKIGQEIADLAFTLQQESNERRKNFEIDQLTISDQRARDVLQSRLDSNLISQAEFESNRLALEQRTADEREQIEREAFEKKKDIDSAKAIINGLLAITQSLANTTLPFPASLIGPATVALSTGVQVAQIRSQQFGGGGLLRGKSHAQGGIPGIVEGTTPVEMEGGEAIITKNATRKHLPLLSAINRDGGGVPLMARGGLPVPSIKYQGGGVAGVNPIDIRAIVEETISGVTSTIRVENVASQTLDVALDVNNLESELSN